MNKKIKVIELLNKIANGEYPKRFKYKNKIYEYKRIAQGTGYVTDDYSWFNSDICIDDWDNLNEDVEILEDNTEEIEELKGETFEQLGYEVGKMSMAIAKGFEKAIKEIGKEKSNDN